MGNHNAQVCEMTLHARIWSAYFPPWALLLWCILTIVGTEGQVQVARGRVPTCEESSRPAISICVKKGYSRLTRPDRTRPTYVHVHIRFNDVEEVNDEHQSISMHMHMTVRWEDKRVVLLSSPSRRRDDDEEEEEEGRVLDEDLYRSLWMPDFAIYSLKRFDYAHVMQRLATMKIYANSTLTYSFQTRTTVNCIFNFDSYPMDKQDCYFLVGSFGHSSQEMIYDGDFYHPQERQRPLAVKVTIRDLKKKERMVEARNETGQVVALYSVYGFVFHTERGIKSFIFKTYFPSAMGVFASWTSFMLKQDAVAGRLSLLVTLTWMQINIYIPLTKDRTPSEISAIEVWVISCLASVALALLEFSLVIYKKSPLEQKRREHVKSRLLTKLGKVGRDSKEGRAGEGKDKGRKIGKLRDKAGETAKGCCAVIRKSCDTRYIDICSLVVFPLGFIIFNVWYWTYYKT